MYKYINNSKQTEEEEEEKEKLIDTHSLIYHRIKKKRRIRSQDIINKSNKFSLNVFTIFYQMINFITLNKL
jgi:hypothetical protein